MTSVILQSENYLGYLCVQAENFFTRPRMTARPCPSWVYDRIRVTVVLALYDGSGWSRA